MAHNKKKIYKKAIEEIQKNKLFFVEDVVSYLPCTKSTFYTFFPKDSDELDAIKEILEENKVKLKVAMRHKWYQSEHPTLQVALMKLIGSDEEASRLNGSRQDISITSEQPLFPDVKV